MDHELNGVEVLYMVGIDSIAWSINGWEIIYPRLPGIGGVLHER